MFGLGGSEILVLLILGVLMVGVPIVIILVVLALVRRPVLRRVDELEAETRRLREQLDERNNRA